MKTIKNLKILNKKEIKEISALFKKQYDIDLLHVAKDYAFVLNDQNRIYIVNRDIDKIDLNKIKINSIGLYIAEINRGDIRLSIEGSQMFGQYAKKNIIDLDEYRMKKWLKGEDLEIKGDYSGFVILKCKEDYLGSGKFVKGLIYNYVNKVRRIHSSD